MAILTDLMIEIDEGYDNPKFGVSKALSNYTLDEIWNSSYVGANFPVHRMISKSTGEAARYWSTDITRPYTIGSLIYLWGQYIGARIASSGAMDDDEYAEDGIYTKTIWLYSASTIPQTVTDLTSVRMVTQMDFTRFKLKFTRTSGQSNGEGAVAWGDTKSYGTQKSNAYLLDNSDPNNPVWTESGNIMLIRPYQMIKVDDKYCLIDALTPYYSANYLGGYNADTPKEVVTGYSTIDNSIKFGLLQSLKKTSDSYSEIRWYESTWAVNYPSMYDNYKAYMQNRNTSQGYNQTVVYPTTQDEFQKNIMGYGVYFQTDRTYKPIIADGYVTGYTSDLTAASELDGYTGSAIHVVPDSKPGGGGGGGGDDDDPSDDQGWGGAYSGAGAFSKFYLCTATDLANLRTWFGGGGSGDPIPDGFDPMGQVLGLLQYPVSISGTALAAEEIIFRSGRTIVHTNVNATRSTGGFLHLDCGSVEIPRRMQERGVPFLDFETSLEIYVPFCGTAPLDVQTCVGKTLTCDMYVATATGDVSAVIAAGGHPVAYMSGNMAESLPISSSGYGMYLAACKSTWGNGVSQVMNQLTGGTTSTIKNVNQAALNETLSYGQTGGWGQSELLAESYNNPTIGRGMAGAASAKGVAAIGLTTTALNIANAASTGYEQYQRVKNASYTSVSGSFTSCAAWNYPFTPYVKITRPHKQIPDNYKHTAAIPLVETKTLSGAPGLTTCVNPDVSGISNATAQEKDIIYRALVNGVIV